MKLIFLENESSVGPLLASPDYRAGQDRVICLNWLALICLRKAGPAHLFTFGEDLLSGADLADLQEHIDAIAFGWFRPGGRDLTQVDTVSVGELAVGVPLRSYLLGVLLKYGEIIRQAVYRWPGAEVILHDLAAPGISGHLWADEDGSSFNKARLVSTVAGQLGLTASFLPPPHPLLSAL